jgi:hypothetical protein
MKTIKGDLVLKKDMVFNESITVEGNITCKGGRFNLTVKGNISARNITAWNIDAGNISALNINAGNITAGNISAWDISYYAFCVAYASIKCVSIKGRREHSFHKALDGKITIKKKPKGKEGT